MLSYSPHIFPSHAYICRTHLTTHYLLFPRVHLTQLKADAQVHLNSFQRKYYTSPCQLSLYYIGKDDKIDQENIFSSQFWLNLHPFCISNVLSRPLILPARKYSTDTFRKTGFSIPEVKDVNNYVMEMKFNRPRPEVFSGFYLHAHSENF